MKRIKAECLEQTLHFLLKDGVPAGEAEQPDGSLMIKVKRQNNYHPVGHYLD